MKRSTRYFRTVAALGVGVALAACAALRAPGPATPFRDPLLSMTQASGQVVLGHSSADQVVAALGPASVIRFDSGFEVWAYRSASPGINVLDTELILLFDPTGTLQKMRLREPAPTKP